MTAKIFNFEFEKLKRETPELLGYDLGDNDETVHGFHKDGKFLLTMSVEDYEKHIAPHAPMSEEALNRILKDLGVEL